MIDTYRDVNTTHRYVRLSSPINRLLPFTLLLLIGTHTYTEDTVGQCLRKEKERRMNGINHTM